MKSNKREAGAEAGISLAADVVLTVNPRVTSRWSSRFGETDNRARHVTAVADESVGLSTLRGEERTLLGLTDGRRTVEDLARLAGMPNLVAIQHLRALCDRGVLVPADSVAPGESLGPASPWSPDAGEAQSGPVEYEYGTPVDTSYDDDPAPTVGAQTSRESGPSSGAASTASAATTLPTSTPTKKSASGPNVTLFWLPTSHDGDVAGGGTPSPLIREATSESTVVVKGSPASGPTPAPAPAPAPTAAPAPAASVVERGATAAPSIEVPGLAAGAPSAPIPFRVGAYEVATRLAQGAMGSIYVCRRVGAVGFQRLFTLKVVREHSTQKDVAIKSFLREARVGALLNHPNIQTLIDVGTYEEQPFLILDYIEGTSLADLLIDDGHPPAPIAISILLDTLRGLHHVHSVVDEHGTRLGLVHGDVSPQNILIGVDGASRLTDFGSARFTSEPKAAETDPVAVGKPAYMAPEQLRGEPIDARTDVFSVGVALWTALTGQRLFSADTYDQTVMKVMRRKIPPPSELGAPACFDPIVLKALSRSPDGRYASAEEMASEIVRAAAAENLVASPRDVGDWVRREIGETLADRRRKIQDMFGAVAMPPATSATARPAAPARPRYPTPKTNADGSHRLPAKTVQLGDIAARVATALANRKPLPEAPPPAAVPQPSRAQWYLVIASAILATGALAVAIAYFVSSLSVTPKRAKAPIVAPAMGANARYVGDPPTAPGSAEQTTDPAASHLDPSRGQ